jgi:membrane protease YdiL (CAAX protease family)
MPWGDIVILDKDSATVSRRVVVKEKMQAFLDLAHSGRNDWWRFVLAILLTLFMWKIIGTLPGAALYIWISLREGLPPGTTFGSSAGTTTSFVLLMLASVFFMCGIYLAIRFIHRRPLWTLVTPAQSIDWRRLFKGFAVWFVLAVFTSGVEALLYPGRYVWNQNIQQFLPFVCWALILVPIQTSAEELLFRGYLLQGFGLRLRNIWLLSAISGLLFGLPHLLNPEASVNYPLLFLYYFAFGFSLAYITLRDGRLELALGAHAANNLFTFIFANYKISVLPTPSIFTITMLDALYSVPAGLIAMAIFIWLFSSRLRRKETVLD